MDRQKQKPIRTRIAPSPTGLLHVGTARAALFNELFARQQGGKFVLRIEDTDQQRSEKRFEDDIIAGFKWLGLEWDEGPDVGGQFGPYRQSARKQIYRAALEKLISAGTAQPVPGSAAICFKVTEAEVEFTDLIRGKVKVPTVGFGGDFIVARSLDDPLYHLAAVVDDAMMEISHVIRGEDHLTNTARHILLQRALGYQTPQYAHLPLLLDASRRKLSKRAGDVSLLKYQGKGFLPEAMLNYLALLGWNPGGERELFSHEELVQAFSLQKVQKGGAIFSLIKLASMNKQYLQQLDDKSLLAWGRNSLEQEKEKNTELLQMNENRLLLALKTERGRLATGENLGALLPWARLTGPGEFDASLLIWRDSTGPDTVSYLSALAEKLGQISSENWKSDELTAAMLQWIKEKSWRNGDVLWPMRVALTGQEHSPGPFEVAAVIGPEETAARVIKARDRLRDSISGL